MVTITVTITVRVTITVTVIAAATTVAIATVATTRTRAHWVTLPQYRATRPFISCNVKVRCFQQHSALAVR